MQITKEYPGEKDLVINKEEIAPGKLREQGDIISELVNRARLLENENHILQMRVDSLSETTLKQENKDLLEENTELRNTIEELKLENSSLKVSRCQALNSEEALKAINHSLAKEVKEREGEIKEREKELREVRLSVDEELRRRSCRLDEKFLALKGQVSTMVYILGKEV